MKLDPKEKLRLNHCPSQKLPYGVVEQDYARPMAQILDDLATARHATLAKQLQPDQFGWELVWDRCRNPEYVPDNIEFLVNYFVTGSKCYLRAKGGDIGGRWVGYEDLTFTPEIVIAKYEQHARGLIEEKNRQRQTPVEVVGEAVQQHRQSDLAAALRAWLRSHPKADADWAKVAEAAVFRLIQSGG